MLLVRPKTHCGCSFSTAAVGAIASAAGLSATFIDGGNDYGVDASVKTVRLFEGRYQDEGELFDIQIKSSTSWRRLSDGRISYGIDRETHARLKGKLPGRKRLLIVMALPPAESDSWIVCSAEQVSLLRAVYFMDVDDIPEIEGTNGSMTIHFLESHLLNPERLRAFADSTYESIMGRFGAI